MTKAEKITVWGSTAVMTATGVAIGWMEHAVTPSDAFAVVNHPWQPFLLKLHILSAPVMVFGIGMIFMRHIWPHFRNGLKMGRRSVIGSMLLTVPMIVSGYAIQVLTSASWLRILGWAHLVLGVMFAIGATIHFVATNRRARKARKIGEQPPNPKQAVDPFPAPRPYRTATQQHVR